MHRAVIVRTAQGHSPRRWLGDPLRHNAAVLVNKNEEPIGTRIFGPVVRELRGTQAHEDHLARAGGAVMAAAKIKKGDKRHRPVRQGQGQDRQVTQAMPKDGKVIVSGVNVATRHRKPSQADPQGGLERSKRRCTFRRSRIVTADGKPTRVRFETGKDGKKVRVAVKTGEKIDG